MNVTAISLELACIFCFTVLFFWLVFSESNILYIFVCPKVSFILPILDSFICDLLCLSGFLFASSVAKEKSDFFFFNLVGN